MRNALLLFLIALPVMADEKPKPNTLTPKEIAEGWILLFDGETTFGWKVDGDVKVVDGAIRLGGKENSSIKAPIILHKYECLYELSHDGKSWGKAGGLFTSSSGEDLVSGLSVRDAPDGLVFLVKPAQMVYLRSIKLRPQQMKPLFNAKDLTGWKEFKATKEKKVTSKYTVTKEGWLNVKDGPGDLQTEGQWADFVLQFDCISNGKHLNSGIFFRCIPDLYQQGYEAQIRNEWMGDDRTKPVDYGTGAIYRRKPARKVVSTDGEWFTMTVAAHGRHIATWVNGYQTVDWTDDRKEADNGRQGFKKSKGALSIQGHDPTTDLSFRNFRIQSLDGK